MDVGGARAHIFLDTPPYYGMEGDRMRIFWLFMIYSLLGFLVETLYTWLRTGRLANRKTMLLLPICPVYGLGGLAVALLAEAFPASPAAIALTGALACSAIEYGYSLLCETIFGVRLWDYGSGPGPIHGRVHLLYCACWGLLALVAAFWVQPLAQRVVDALPAVWFLPAVGLFVADAAATSAMLYRFGHGGRRVPGCPVARRARENKA
jgi:uncharacterized membrane protein